MNLTNRLERVFGSLSKTLFYEHQSISALSGYFVDAHAAAPGRTAPSGSPRACPRTLADETTVRGGARPGPARPAVGRRSPREPVRGDTDIAIIGVAGRYPQAATSASSGRT